MEDAVKLIGAAAIDSARCWAGRVWTRRLIGKEVYCGRLKDPILIPM